MTPIFLHHPQFLRGCPLIVIHSRASVNILKHGILIPENRSVFKELKSFYLGYTQNIRKTSFVIFSKSSILIPELASAFAILEVFRTLPRGLLGG
jgi:hypothetical protein